MLFWYAASFLIISIALLSVWDLLMRRKKKLLFLDYISGTGPISLRDFFRIYLAFISNLPVKRPGLVRPLSAPINFSGDPGKKSILPVIKGIADTIFFTRLVMLAAKYRDKAICRRIADILATIWGARLIERSRATFNIQGLDNLNNVSGRSLFVANHKSFSDFFVVPMSIGFANMKRKQAFAPRYMAARDHFRDNFFLYRILGIGRTLEKIGTVFVDRKARREKPTDAVNTAVRAIVDENVDIVMFPQGTRAHGSLDALGRRLNLGYYTTGSKEKLLLPLGHMKKGAAYLALEAAKELTARGEWFNIIPLGLIGTGVLCPRGKIMMQKGVDIKVVVGRPLTIQMREKDGELIHIIGGMEFEGQKKEAVKKILAYIDNELKNISKIHPELLRQALLEFRKIFDPLEVEKFLEAISAWRSDENLIYSVIDCIFSTPASKWEHLLRRFYQLLVDADTPREELLNFKATVIEEMFKGR